MAKEVLRVAAKAVIVNSAGKILIVREASTYKEGTGTGRYRMPGGRLEEGENYAEGLRREVAEETGLEVEPLYPIFVGEWQPVINGVPHHIVAIFTVCRAKGSVSLSEEHDDFKWILPNEAKDYDIMAPEPEVIKRYAQWAKEGLPR